MNRDRRWTRIRELRRRRPRQPFLRWSLLSLGVLFVICWTAGGFLRFDGAPSRRLANLERFLGELRPYPLQAGGGGGLGPWLAELMAERGWEATRITLAISILAILLAAAAGLVASLLAARNLQRANPFSPWLPGSSGGAGFPLPVRIGWRSISAAARAGLIFLRAVPEFVWAFLLLLSFGPNAWPAILALAIHNTGILGKLDAEIVEDLPVEPLAALRDLGASRIQVVLTGIVPIALPRFLLLLFYRWETCVREATVLGLLGIVSLGYWIEDARARQHYDEMLVFILLGSALVLLGDAISTALRAAVRRWG